MEPPVHVRDQLLLPQVAVIDIQSRAFDHGKVGLDSNNFAVVTHANKQIATL